MEEKIAQLKAEAAAAVQGAVDVAALNDIRVKYFFHQILWKIVHHSTVEK